MANSLLKTAAHNSFADGIFKEILSRSTRYYYFIGKTLTWINEAIPSMAVDSRAYERECRNEIISMKEITPSDIAYVIPRINWISNTIYDIYDDQYSSEIQGLNLISGGSIYASPPTITIGTIVPTSIVVIANVQYYYSGALYTVKSGGITGASNTVLLGVIGTDYVHGSTVMSCVGTQATATCVVGTTGVNNQKIISTTMVDRGYGYTYVPVVSFSSGAASATAIITDGIGGVQKLENTQYYVYNAYNVYICIDNNNRSVSTVAPTGISSGYLSTADGYVWKYMSSVLDTSKFLTTDYIPIYTATQYIYSANGSIINVYVDNSGTGYLSANTIIPLLTSVLLGDKYFYNGYVYTVSIAGITSSTYTGLGTTINTPYSNGTATFTCNGVITTITVTGDGVNAMLTPIVTDGRISDVQINDAGSQYSYANFLITGAGNSASISSSLFSGTAQYSHQAQIEAAVINGNICKTQIISGGYNYTNPVISITGDGTGATATATAANGIITKITISNRGSNYNWANIIITDSTGAGATARAILSPFGGLGRDAINQLCCRSLMFYAKMSDNTNQGLAVSNDYRQVGIIKDPTRYKDGTLLTSNFASPCWKVTATGSINAGILVDDVVTTVSNSITYRFRVASISGIDVLLIPLDNGVPASGMQFLKTSVLYFIAAYVIAPTSDKYSGDLLFIDNEPTFIATSDSPALLRTVINF